MMLAKGDQLKGRGKTILTWILATVFALVALGAWAVSSPVGSSPDDDFHLASIWCSSPAEDSLCHVSSTPGKKEVSTQITRISCFAYHPETSAVCQEKVLGKDSFELTDRGNFQGEYPPVFYAVNHLFAGNDVQASVLGMRFFNLALFVVTSLVLFTFLSTNLRRAFGLTWAISIVPLGVFLIASTNPSSWAIFGLINSIFALIGFFQSSENKHKLILAMLYGLFLIIAVGSRPDASVYAGMFVVILTFAFWNKGRKIDLWLPASVLGASLLVYFWSHQNVVTTTASLSTATGGAAQQISERNPIGVLGFNLLQLPELFSGALGSVGLGWLDTRMPGMVWVSCLSVFVAVVFYFLRKLKGREAIGVSVLALLLIAIPLVVLQMSLSRVGENVQPRYIYPLLIGFAAVVIVFGIGNGLRLGFTQYVLASTLIVIANSLALYTNLSRYVQGQGWGTNWNLNAAAIDGWWWPWQVGPMIVWAIGSAGFACLIVFMLWDQIKDSRAQTTISH